MKRINASLIVSFRDGRRVVYGLRIEDGEVVGCTERSAVPDPESWLSARYHGVEGFERLDDDGAAYRADLRRELFG